jgi:NADH-quinone oxidoreductase subunit N
VTTAVAAAAIAAPHLQYRALLPILIVLGVATVGVLVEALVPAEARRNTQLTLSLGGLVAAFVAVVANHDRAAVVAQGMVAQDKPTLFLQGTILLLAFLSFLFMAEKSLDAGGGAFVGQASTLPGSSDERLVMASGREQTELFPLAMFAVGGMLLFPASNNLLLMFVALEVFSLPLYLLCGLARRRRLLSQEAAMKYFLLGAFSSAFFLYGIALVYGFAHSVDLGAVRAAASHTQSDTLLFAGVALIAVGLLFKVSAVPFHSWTPDVYQGAPTPITAFMGACTKVAAFGALLRVFYVGFGPLRWDVRPVLWAVAILTMVVGSLLALTQTDVKRMLAYSSIAHAGFLLTGLLAYNANGLAGTMFYLLTYGFSTVGAFAIVSLVRDADGEATHLSQWRGLGRRSPAMAGAFTLFLLGLAGIPLTSGFMGKYAVFLAAIDGGATPVVIVGLVASGVAAFFYVRVIVLMYWQDPAPDGPTVAVPSVLTNAAIAISVAVTVVLGVWPQSVLDLAHQAGPFLP